MKSLIDAIKSNDNQQIKEEFKKALFDKLSRKIEEKKKEIGKSITDSIKNG